MLIPSDLKLGKRYNWKKQTDRLIYIGTQISNGLWYQFAKIDKPNIVWCEVREDDLHMMEETSNG